MKTDYKTLDKFYHQVDNTDRPNRGVKLTGWLIAMIFSCFMWFLIYLIF